MGTDELRGGRHRIAIDKAALDIIIASPLFANWSREDVVRLIPYARTRHLNEGDYLYRQGQDANELFLIADGKLRLDLCDGKHQQIGRGMVGEEAVIGADCYSGSACALEAMKVITIDREFIHQTLEQKGEKGVASYLSLIQRYTDLIVPNDSNRKQKSANKSTSLFTNIGWIMIFVAPISILLLSDYYYEQYPLSWEKRHFLAAFSVTLVMWIFKLAPPYIGGLFTIIACLVLGVVPSDTILSGFSSGSFFMAMSIIALGSVLIRSGLTYRFVLFILQHSPNNAFSYNLGLLFSGILLTPVIPSTNARVNLFFPVLKDMIDGVGYEKKSREATQLALSMFVGVSIFTPVFMTSKSLNFIVFGMLPQQIQDNFQWLHWLTAASLAGLVILILYLGITSYLFRHSQRPKLSKTQIKLQRDMLGPMTSSEWVALSGVLIFVLAVVTSSIHKISPPWVSLAIFFGFLSLGVIKSEHIKRDIEWSFLLLLGSMIGLVSIIKYTGLDAQIAEQLSFIGHNMEEQFYLFVLTLIGVIFVLRMFLPITASGLLAATVFIPLADASGVNPWVVAFFILMVAESWWLPYQSSYYLLFETLNEKHGLYDRSIFMRINALTILVRLAAVFASIPYFQAVGLL